VALAGLVALLAVALAVRVWLMFAYSSAFVGFGDSHEYVHAAVTGVFSDLQKPAGYPIFLRVVHLFDDRLSSTIAVQHTLGLAAAVLLYGAVRRTGSPPWLGLLPAAVVLFGGGGPLLEHSLLADGPFAFLQALAVYAAVRALGEFGVRWALLAGVAVGTSFWVKTVGLSGAVVIPLVLVLATTGGVRHRLTSAAAAALAALVVMLAYPAVQGQVTGYWGYERQGAWNLYGRIATFVDCTSFTPPPGTRFLCPNEAPRRRHAEAFYQYAPAAPAVRRFGGPARAPSYANAWLQRFSVAAIEHQPLAYVGAILRGLTYFVTPRAGEGYTPSSLRDALLDPKGVASVEPTIASYFTRRDSGYVGHASSTRALASYDEHTQVQGWLLILLLLAALVGTPLLGSRARAAAALFTLTAIGSATFAVAGNSYDARYAYPALGPLAAGAALGAWGIYARFSRGYARAISTDRSQGRAPMEPEGIDGERTAAAPPVIVQYLYVHAPGERFDYPSSRSERDPGLLAARYLECVLVQAASLCLRGVDCDLVLATNLTDRRTVGSHGARLLAEIEALGVEIVFAEYLNRPEVETVTFASSRYVFDAIRAVAERVSDDRRLLLVDVDCVWLDAPKLFAALPPSPEIGCIHIDYPEDWAVAERTPTQIAELAGQLGAPHAPVRWVGGELLTGTAADLCNLASVCGALELEVINHGQQLNTEEHLLTLAGALGRARFHDLAAVAQRVWTGPRHDGHRPPDPARLGLLHLPSEKGLSLRRAARAVASGHGERLVRDLEVPVRALRRFNVQGAGWTRRLRDDGWLAKQRLREKIASIGR